MSRITTIILTGGEAIRMQPLSNYECKTMISFMGKPLLLHLINALNRYHFTDIICTSPGKRGEIEKYFSNGREYGVNIKYFGGRKWRGTAGIVKNLVTEMRNDVADTIMVIYGDSLLKANYKKMLQFHRQKESTCTILYHRPDFESFIYEYHDGDESYEKSGKRTNYGVMDLASGDQITYIEEKPLLTTIKNKFINPVANATVYLLEREIIEYIPSDRLFDFPGHLFPEILKQGVQFFGFDIEKGYRVDIGTLSNYYQTQFEILNGEVEFEFYFPSLDKGIWVAENSRNTPIEVLKKPILVGENCRIDQSTNIECSIIGNNVNIGKFSTINKSIILDEVQIGQSVNISYSIIGENCFIGNNISLSPNTVLGSSCRLGTAQIY